MKKSSLSPEYKVCPNFRTQIIGTSVTCPLSAWHMLRNLLGRLEVPALYFWGSGWGGEGREKEPQYRGCGTIHFCPRDRAIKSLLQWLWNSLAPRWFLSEPHSWGHKAPPVTNPAQQKKSLYNQSGQKVVCALPTLCPHCDEQPYAGSTCISLFCLLFPQSLHWAKRKQPESLPKVVYTVQAFTPWGNSIYLLRAWDQMG